MNIKAYADDFFGHKRDGSLRLRTGSRTSLAMVFAALLVYRADPDMRNTCKKERLFPISATS